MAKEIDSKQRRILISLGLVFVLVLLATTAAGYTGTTEGMSWIITPEAAARTESGECVDIIGTVCKELCMLTAEGGLDPQGSFSCLPAFF